MKSFFVKFFVLVGLLLAWFAVFALIQSSMEYSLGFRMGALPQYFLVFALVVWPFRAFCRHYNKKHRPKEEKAQRRSGLSPASGGR